MKHNVTIFTLMFQNKKNIGLTELNRYPESYIAKVLENTDKVFSLAYNSPEYKDFVKYKEELLKKTPLEQENHAKYVKLLVKEIEELFLKLQKLKKQRKKPITEKIVDFMDFVKYRECSPKEILDVKKLILQEIEDIFSPPKEHKK